jgi:methyltransferase
MVTPALLLQAYLVALLAERGAELALSERNARATLARGGVEAGRGHYLPMVAVHVAFLVGCAAEPMLRPRPWPLPAALVALAVALLAMALRWWAVATLGSRWSTRVVVLPGAPPVTGGPYRWLRHPNYLAVSVELLAVPLIAGALWTALLATLANAALLAIRVRVEEQALGPGWAQAFQARPRQVPGRRP